MSYYKITYESSTIEGLKAIQGGFAGEGTSSTDSAFEIQAPPPPMDEEDADASTGFVQPLPLADEADEGPDFQGEDAFYPPPSEATDPATMDTDLEGEIPPPPGK